MKIQRGKIKLEKNDYRVGNFVVTEETDHMKVQDISGVMSFRVSKYIAKGQLLLAMVQDRQDKALQNYIAVAYNFLATVPDLEMLEKVNGECVACLERHKDLYGVDENISKEEDDAILKEEQEMAEAREEFAESAKRVDAELEARKNGEKKSDD